MANNYFTHIRLFLALCVAFEHVFYFKAGAPSSPFELGHTSLAYVAVNAFFIISGYLITGSAERSGSLATFFRSRLLRIMPALLMLSLTLAFVLVPIFNGALPLTNLTDTSAWQAIFIISSFIDPYQDWPGVMVSNSPLPSDITGAVWTLRYEMLAYIGTGVLLVAKLHKNVPIAIAGTLIASLLFAIDLQTGRLTEVSATLGALLRFGSCYMYGVCFYLLRDRISVGLVPSLIGIAFGCWFLLIDIPLGEIFINVGLTPLIFAVAYSQRKAPDWIANPSDYSYGLYICHWAVFQVLIHVFGTGALVPMLLLGGIPLAMLVAAASWHFIEKPALRLKAKGALKPSGS